MKKTDSTFRLVNGIVAVALLVFVAVHGALGGLSGLELVGHTLKAAAWFGVVLSAAHLLLSIVTSRFMLTDVERPPSDKKKRHLVLKWVTGALVLVALAAHVALRVAGAGAVADLATTALLLVTLAVHSCVGSKSLLKDLGQPRSLRDPLRIVICVFAALLFALLAAGTWLWG